ncbi:MAG: pseudouridine synthase [Candidatus Korobacteraceae bacterium]
MPAERLQKIIAAAGIASRRKAEELITQGMVSVNGQTVTELGTKADPEIDRIKVNGKPLSGPERHVYLLLHKPKGYVTTVTDPEGRPTVLDLLRGVGTRVYPVGRLDYLSEGLLLLTNDGELAQKLTHASSHVPKTYLVKVSGRPADSEIEKLRHGIKLPPERAPLKPPAGKPRVESRRRSEAVQTAPARIQLLGEAANPWYEVTLVEGRNRQIRRMFEQIGHHVEKIKRVRYGPLELNVEPGKFRHLTPREVAQLKAAASGRAFANVKRNAEPAGPSQGSLAAGSLSRTTDPLRQTQVRRPAAFRHAAQRDRGARARPGLPSGQQDRTGKSATGKKAGAQAAKRTPSRLGSAVRVPTKRAPSHLGSGVRGPKKGPPSHPGSASRGPRSERRRRERS